MSPREKHVPDDAERTSVCLTAEDRGAIHWISESRRNRKDKRTTTNDILVDALWHFVETVEGRTREQIRASIPPKAITPTDNTNVRQMPKRNKKN
jgi:hypothetical protein